MKLTGLDHIAINCRDMENTRKFYESVFGLKRLDDIDMGDHVLHYYQLPGIRLELIEYKKPQKNWKTGDTDTGIYRHFALCADDLQEIEKRCDNGGFGINLRPTYIDGIGKTVMLVVDPNGVEIEVIRS